MLTLRNADERGQGNHGWLTSRHTFSFANYIDPAHRGFRNLRVINEDRVEGGAGFGTHGHENMEIFSWVVSGGLTHRDSMGHEKTVQPGGLQYMSAGSGVHHSEYNASQTEPVHFLQVWIIPNERNADPRYEDKDFTAALAEGGLVLVASRDGRDGSIAMRADADVYTARPTAGTELRHDLDPGHAAWIQVVTGTIDVNGTRLAQGDGLAVEDETGITLRAESNAEFLLFDLG